MDSTSTPSQQESSDPTDVDEASLLEDVIEQLATRFAAERKKIESELGQTEGNSREVLLVSYGFSSTAKRHFETAAAACAMFLYEFGWEHPDSIRVAMKLAELLAPLDTDNVEIKHTSFGPKCKPNWARPGQRGAVQLHQAARLYELAAENAQEDRTAGSALFTAGWIYRAADDWAASTDAWDRCAEIAPNSRLAPRARWLAAENQAWTGQLPVAVARLRELAATEPDDRRAAHALQQAETWEAQARRTPEWLEDPVRSFVAELERRSASRSRTAIYRSVMIWLRQEGHEPALRKVNRWVSEQTDWPALTRIEAYNGLVRARISGDDARPGDYLKAAELLQRVIDIAPSVAWEVPAALYRVELLSKAGRPGLAAACLDEIRHRVDGLPRWEPEVLAETTRLLRDRGDYEQAAAVFETLSTVYPHHGLTEELAPTTAGAEKEEKQ
jgi:tetratricopeptide (TPR) repeat protein